MAPSWRPTLAEEALAAAGRWVRIRSARRYRYAAGAQSEQKKIIDRDTRMGIAADDLAVEVPGIEPGSFVASSGLLRAQLTMPLLAPTDHVSKSVWQAQSLIDLAARSPRPGPVGQPPS